MNRRDFLKISGLLSAALFFPFFFVHSYEKSAG